MEQHSSSLYDIEQSISGLLEVLEDQDITEDERVVAQQELARWIEAEVAKVDRVRGFLRHCAIMADVARTEAKEIAARAKVWEDRASRLKTLCMQIMEARGVRRLEGATGVLRVRNNGGRQALNIRQPELVPDEMRVWRVSLSYQAIQTIRHALANHHEHTALDYLQSATPVIDEALVRAALERGEAVAGAELEPRGAHLRAE